MSVGYSRHTDIPTLYLHPTFSYSFRYQNAIYRSLREQVNTDLTVGSVFTNAVIVSLLTNITEHFTHTLSTMKWTSFWTLYSEWTSFVHSNTILSSTHTIITAYYYHFWCNLLQGLLINIIIGLSSSTLSLTMLIQRWRCRLSSVLQMSPWVTIFEVPRNESTLPPGFSSHFVLVCDSHFYVTSVFVSVCWQQSLGTSIMNIFKKPNPAG